MVELVKERSVREAMRDCAPRLQRDLREVAQQAAADPRIGMLLFFVDAGAAFDRFPIFVSAWSAEGREVDSVLWDFVLVPGRSLLPPEGSYPLGRVDWRGIDTTPDAALVDRIVKDGLRIGWREAIEGIAAPTAFVESWHEEAFVGRRRVTDLATGDDRMIELFESP